jgi:cell division protein FtsB
VALAVGLAYVPYRLLDAAGARRVRALQAELAKVRAAQAALLAENERHRREIRGLRSDPSVLEEIAREDLGVVRADEIIIKIESDERGRR